MTKATIWTFLAALSLWCPLSTTASAQPQEPPMTEVCSKTVQGWGELGLEAPKALKELCVQIDQTKDTNLAYEQVDHLKLRLSHFAAQLLAAKGCSDVTRAMLGFPSSRCAKVDTSKWVAFANKWADPLDRIKSTATQYQDGRYTQIVAPDLAALGIKAPVLTRRGCLAGVGEQCHKIVERWEAVGATKQARDGVAACNALLRRIEENPSCETKDKVDDALTDLRANVSSAEECLNIVETIFEQRPPGCFAVTFTPWKSFERKYKRELWRAVYRSSRASPQDYQAVKLGLARMGINLRASPGT